MSVPGGVKNDAFAHRTREGGEVTISHHGHPIVKLRGGSAARFLARVEGLEDREATPDGTDDRQLQARQRMPVDRRTGARAPDARLW